MSDAATQPLDPASVLRQRSYRALLVLAAIIGVVVSLTLSNVLGGRGTSIRPNG